MYRDKFFEYFRKSMKLFLIISLSCLGLKYFDTYISPFLDFDLCHMFDRDFQAISVSHSSINNSESPFSKNRSNLVELFKRLAGRPEHLHSQYFNRLKRVIIKKRELFESLKDTCHAIQVDTRIKHSEKHFSSFLTDIIACSTQKSSKKFQPTEICRTSTLAQEFCT